MLNNDDKAVTLGDLTKDNGIIIFMYPKANTGGCTKYVWYTIWYIFIYSYVDILYFVAIFVMTIHNWRQISKLFKQKNRQACGFRDNYAEIEKAGYKVYGMSFDKPKSQTNWKNKYNLPYNLLTDQDGTVLKALGAFKAPKNVLRSHVIIAKGGKVVDMRNGISPGDSFAEAVKTVTEKKK